MKKNDAYSRIVDALTDESGDRALRVGIRLWFFSDRETARKQKAFMRHAETLPTESGKATDALRERYNAIEGMG